MRKAEHNEKGTEGTEDIRKPSVKAEEHDPLSPGLTLKQEVRCPLLLRERRETCKDKTTLPR